MRARMLRGNSARPPEAAEEFIRVACSRCRGVGVHVLTRLSQRDMRPSAARSLEVACHSQR